MSYNSFEISKSENSSKSFHTSENFLQSHSSQSRRKTLFFLKSGTDENDLIFRKRSSVLLSQQRLSKEPVFENFDINGVEINIFKECPLIPNGTWAHIPLKWLSMMTSIIDVINEAIQKDDIEILFKLEESQKKFYHQILKSVPSINIKNTTKLNEINKCLRKSTSSTSNKVLNSIEEISCQITEDEEKEQWYIPQSSVNAPYFEVPEDTALQELLEFMMTLPSVGKKMKKHGSADETVKSGDEINMDFDQLNSLSVMDLIQPQNTSTNEQSFIGLLESTLEYGTLINEKINIAPEDFDDAEFNIKYIIKMPSVINAKEKPERKDNFKRSQDKRWKAIKKQKYIKKGSKSKKIKKTRFEQIIEEIDKKVTNENIDKIKNGKLRNISDKSIIKIKYNNIKKIERRKSMKGNNKMLLNHNSGKIDKNSIKKKNYNDRVEDYQPDSIIQGTENLHRKSENKSDSITLKDDEDSEEISDFIRSSISLVFHESIKPSHIEVTDSRRYQNIYKFQGRSSKSSLNRDLIHSEIIEQSEIFLKKFYSNNSKKSVLKYDYLTKHSNGIKREFQNESLKTQPSIPNDGIENPEIIDKQINEDDFNFLRKEKLRNRKDCSREMAMDYDGSLTDKDGFSFPMSLGTISFTRISGKEPFECHSKNSLLSKKSKKFNSMKTDEDLLEIISDIKAEYNLLKEKYFHLYNPRIISSTQQSNRRKTFQPTLDMNTIVGNLMNFKGILQYKRRNSDILQLHRCKQKSIEMKNLWGKNKQ